MAPRGGTGRTRQNMKYLDVTLGRANTGKQKEKPKRKKEILITSYCKGTAGQVRTTNPVTTFGVSSKVKGGSDENQFLLGKKPQRKKGWVIA